LQDRNAVRFDLVTIFPAMVTQALAAGVVGRAIERGAIAVNVHDLRDFTTDRHRVVDDVPYGGGPGMVLKPEPLFRALEAIRSAGAGGGEAGAGAGASGGVSGGGAAPWVVLTSPQGETFTQRVAEQLSGRAHIVVLCGRYEGVDERVRARVDQEISIGDYVLSGGELAALVIVDAVARLVPGVVGDEQSIVDESFSRGLLDFPHYTRPAELGEEKVPEVLLSGNHGEIRRWRKRAAVERTLERRPELLAEAALDDEEREILRQLVAEKPRRT
jgi:tRNA (guanine37-N1)-methyltransferase